MVLSHAFADSVHPSVLHRGHGALLLQIKHCHEIPQCWVFVLVKAVQESLGVSSQNLRA